MEQITKEPTRVTTASSTLIDLIFTNQPNNISNSGVIDLGMSDHSLIYAVKTVHEPIGVSGNPFFKKLLMSLINMHH